VKDGNEGNLFLHTSTGNRKFIQLSAAILLALLTSCAILSASQTSERNEKALDLVQAGLRALQQAQLDKAADDFQAAVQLAPDLAEAHLNLGLVRNRQGKLEKAIESFEKALQLKSSLPGVHAALGIDLLALGKPGEAVPHLEKALEADPNNAEVNRFLGMAYLEEGDLHGGIARLEVALKSKPNDAELLFSLGRAYKNLSAQLFDQITRTAPESPRAHQLAAESHALSGRLGEAVKEYRRVLELNPNLPDIRLALGDLYMDAADYAGAEEAFRQELQVAPANPEAIYKYGVVLLKMGRASDATPYLQKAVIMAPKMADAYFQLGKAFSDEGKLEQAEQTWLKVIELGPTVELAAPTHYQLAQLYRKQERNQEAAKELELFKKTQGSLQKNKTRD
jgi:tetratricopeptide (TPR) repeat protein